MSEVKCPKCHSTQVSAQPKGFSTGKAAAGVVLTGGVGALAGLHGSGKVLVHCLNCGHSWDPVERHKEEQAKRQAAAEGYKKAWVTAFYEAYEANDREAAEAILQIQRGAMLKEIGMDGVYKKLKNEDHTGQVIKVIMILLVLGLITWVASCMT